MRLEKIIVRQDYPDTAYAAFLRQAFRLARASFNGGTQSYYLTQMKPLLEKNASRMHLGNGDPIELDYGYLENNRKLLTDYVGSKYEHRKFNIAIIRIVDAYLQLSNPGFDAAFKKIQSPDKVGQLLGAFLRDETSLDDRYQQSLNAESIRGIFEYDGVDTHHEEIGEKRIVAFLSGESIDYLKLVDFKFDRASETFLPKGADCEPLFGICIPGEEFSPVILRSDSYRTRQLGLLYSPGNLVELTGEMPDELVYEVFTTNKDQLGSNSDADDLSTDGLFLEALNLHFGPRLKRDLEPLSNPQEIAKVADIIDQIATEVL